MVPPFKWDTISLVLLFLSPRTPHFQDHPFFPRLVSPPGFSIPDCPQPFFSHIWSTFPPGQWPPANFFSLFRGSLDRFWVFFSRKGQWEVSVYVVSYLFPLGPSPSCFFPFCLSCGGFVSSLHHHVFFLVGLFLSSTAPGTRPGPPPCGPNPRTAVESVSPAFAQSSPQPNSPLQALFLPVRLLSVFFSAGVNFWEGPFCGIFSFAICGRSVVFCWFFFFSCLFVSLPHPLWVFFFFFSSYVPPQTHGVGFFSRFSHVRF